MKKFLAIVAIASFAVACNNGSEKKETADTTVVAPADTNAAPKMDTATTAPADTTAKKDTAAKM